MRAANDEGPLPLAIAEIKLCERFGCLPSDLDDEDWGRLLTGVALTHDYDVAAKHRRGEKLTTAEDILIGKLYQMQLDNG